MRPMAMVNAKSSSPHAEDDTEDDVEEDAEDPSEDSEDIDCNSGKAGAGSSATGTLVARLAAIAVARRAITGSANGNCVCAAFGDTFRRLTR